MNLHPPTLLFAGLAVLLLAAGVMTWFGWRERCYRGYWWWVGAQWMLLAGLGLQWMEAPGEPILLAAHLLVLQWPISVLTGLRRFYSRHGLPIPSAVDAVLFAVSWLAVPVATALRAPAAIQSWAWCAGPLLLPIYAAWLISRLTEFRSSAALQLLAISLIAAGLTELHRLFGPVTPLPLPGSLVALLPAFVLTHVGLMLSFRRTEQTWIAEHRKLRYLADMDVLTRVANRRHFQELATNALAGTKPEEACVLMFDIDHFRRINDMFGHAAGDEALRQVAQCMRDTLREQDVAGRLSGDQFAILLPETLPKGAMSVAARVVSNLATRQLGPRIAPLSLSFGVVTLYEGEAIADALRRAEQALHEAKRQGRSRVVVATGTSDNPVFTNSRTLGLLSA
jgi:diguanylate cyclase